MTKPRRSKSLPAAPRFRVVPYSGSVAVPLDSVVAGLTSVGDAFSPDEAYSVVFPPLCEGRLIASHGLPYGVDIDRFFAALDIASQEHSGNIGIVWCESGGVGASRVISGYAPKSYSPSEDTKLVVIGSSDSCVYPLIGWLGEFARGIVGPCLADKPSLANFEDTVRLVCEPKYFDCVDLLAEPLNSAVLGLDKQYNEDITKIYKDGVMLYCIPMSIHSLALLPDPTKRMLLDYLRKNSCILLLEDVYAGGSSQAWVSFYDDLTQIIPYIASVYGAVVFGNVDLGEFGPNPATLIQEAFPVSVRHSATTIFYAEGFGHSTSFSIPLEFGARVCVSYAKDKRLLRMRF